MGRLFSWKDVKEKRVPQPSSFVMVERRIGVTLTDANSIIGGLICGSTLYGNHTQRSDIDCVAVYDPNCFGEATEIFQQLSKFANSLYVPLEIMSFDLDIAKTRLHDIGLSFAAHLHNAATNGGIIKEDPLPFFNFDLGFDLTEDNRGYLRNKLKTMKKGINSLDTMRATKLYDFLKKVLEAPIHIARRMLQLSRVEMPDDSKQEVLNHYAKVATLREMELFQRVVGVDSAYTDELVSQLENPDRRRYFEMIKRVKLASFDAFKFVRLNALRLA